MAVALKAAVDQRQEMMALNKAMRQFFNRFQKECSRSGTRLRITA